jgi:hypothetical protein
MIGRACPLFVSLLLVLGGGVRAAAESSPSGLQPGQRPGPYAAVISTGPQRGQSYCYICETGEHPAVVVFARSLSEPLGELVRHFDKAVAEHKAANLRAWVTFLSEDQPSLDAQLVHWSQKHALRSIALGVFEDNGGPPSYRLSRDVDVTVLLFVKQKVVANFTFRSGELTAARIAEVGKALARMVPEKK